MIKLKEVKRLSYFGQGKIREIGVFLKKKKDVSVVFVNAR